jgi:hypothetical protein
LKGRWKDTDEEKMASSVSAFVSIVPSILFLRQKRS